jgi:hypothetical protein
VGVTTRLTDMTTPTVYRSTTSVTNYGILVTDSALHMTAIVTTVLPLPPLPSTSRYFRAAGIMPPLPSHSSPIITIPHDERKFTSSSVAYNATYENLLTFLVVAYFLWALFYGIYILLRASIWLCETGGAMSNTLFTTTRALPARRPKLRYKDENTGEAWMEDVVQGPLSEEVRLACMVSADTWTMPPKLEGQCLGLTIRQRSGTV